MVNPKATNHPKGDVSNVRQLNLRILMLIV